MVVIGDKGEDEDDEMPSRKKKKRKRKEYEYEENPRSTREMSVLNNKENLVGVVLALPCMSLPSLRGLYVRGMQATNQHRRLQLHRK